MVRIIAMFCLSLLSLHDYNTWFLNFRGRGYTNAMRAHDDTFQKERGRGRHVVASFSNSFNTTTSKEKTDHIDTKDAFRDTEFEGKTFSEVLQEEDLLGARTPCPPSRARRGQRLDPLHQVLWLSSSGVTG